MTNDQTYRIYGLKDSDIPLWTQFCADCFADKKPTPPQASYFANQYYSDPRRESELVRVMVTNDSHSSVDGINNPDDNNNSNMTIASSIRIFQRLISVGSTTEPPMEAGGIGEVCTSIHHRNRGLSKSLLQDAMRIMKEDKHMECTLLHAGNPAFRPMYEKMGGYKCVSSHWSVLSIDIDLLFKATPTTCENSDNFGIRLADFPNDTLQLQKIHKAYSEDRFVGCIIRSQDYWNEYLSPKIGNSLYCLTINKSNTINNSSINHHDTIIAWLSIRSRNGRLQLQEFGIDQEEGNRNHVTIVSAMSRLLKYVLEKNQHEFNNDEEHLLHLPTFVLNEMIEEENKHNNAHIFWNNDAEIVQDNDDGWMYKSLSNEDISLSSDDDRLNRDIRYLVDYKKRPHLIWPSDSF